MRKSILYGALVLTLIVVNIIDKSEQKLTAEQKEIKINKIKEELKLIPASKYSKNAYLYKELLELDANNTLFKKKYNHYQQFVDLESHCGSIAYDNTKERVKYPATFKQDGIKTHHLIDGRIRTRINFISKNAFGVPINATALYECWEDKDTTYYNILDLY